MEKLKVDIRYGYQTPFLSVCIEGETTNEPFDNIENWSHLYLYKAALNAMREKGAEVGKDPYYETGYYTSLNKFHDYGNLFGLEFKSEITHSLFRLEFFQNITPSKNKNGGYYDFDKYNKFPYLIKLRLKAAINHLIKTLKPMCDAAVTYTDKPMLNSSEYILNDYFSTERGITSLDEIQARLTPSDLAYNNKDRDRKEIRCGQLKYFYGFNGYLHRGIVYHHCNNMWWVIENDTTLTNIAAFELFDRTDEPIRQVLSPKKKKAKLDEALNEHIQKKNFMRCSSIQREIDKIESSI